MQEYSDLKKFCSAQLSLLHCESQTSFFSMLFVTAMGILAYTGGMEVDAGVDIKWINLGFAGSIIGLTGYVSLALDTTYLYTHITVDICIKIILINTFMPASVPFLPYRLLFWCSGISMMTLVWMCRIL